MSLNNIYRLDVPNLSVEEIVELLKYNKSYAGCCKIVEEKYLSGNDILNLSLEKVTRWKVPKWLVRNLLSLRIVLLKNPESLLQPEEEDRDIVQPPNLELEQNNQYLIMENNSKVKEVYYDEGNYLKSSMTSNRVIIPEKFGRKIAPLVSKRPMNIPVPLPRPDEENFYEAEPPVSQRKVSNFKSHQQTQINKPLPKFPVQKQTEEYDEAEEVYEEPNREEVNEELPPPLPDRSINWKISRLKPIIKNIPNIYVNIEKARTPESTTPKIPTDSIISTRAQPSKPKHPFVSNSEFRSIQTRQLPPLPSKYKQPHISQESLEDESEYINEVQNTNPQETDSFIPDPHNDSRNKQIPTTVSPQDHRPYISQLLSQISSVVKQKNTRNNDEPEASVSESGSKILPRPYNLLPGLKSIDQNVNEGKHPRSKFSRPLPNLPVTSNERKISVKNISENFELVSEARKDEQLHEEEPPQDYINFGEVEKHKTQLKTGSSNHLNDLPNLSSIPREIFSDDSVASRLAKEFSDWKSRRNDKVKAELENVITKPRTPMKLHIPPPPSSIPALFNHELFQEQENQENDNEYGNEDYMPTSDEDEDTIDNPNNEKFYRNTDRKGAMWLLNDLDDGAFVLRSSNQYFLSLTVKKNGKYFNVGIMKEGDKIYCGEGETKTPEFSSLKKFLDYFENTPLILQSKNGLQEVYLKKTLPEDRY